MDTTDAPEGGPPRARFVPAPLRHFLERAPEIRPFALRFFDDDLERRFQRRYYSDALPYIRLAHIMAIATWIIFGILGRLIIVDGQQADLIIRYGIGIPIVAVSLALTYARWYPKVWEQVLTGTVIASGVLWAVHRAFVPDARADWGYAGVMLAQAFCYILTRLQLPYSFSAGAVLLAAYNVVALGVLNDTRNDVLYADFFLFVFAGIGMAAGYGLERSVRVVFLRELELDHERARADDLLRNALPDPIVDRLATEAGANGRSIADAYEEVSVLFADLVGFTEQAGRIAPTAIVESLDAVFTRFDELAGRVDMEKVKTVGDAYMAVSGAPVPRTDHAGAAAEMALGILECLDGERWPGGDPMSVRVGIATGPVVGGVIGRRRFAYDLWGDTVNLASRLESHGEPGRILVSATTYERLRDRYRFSDATMLELKGKGPTEVWFLLGRM